MSFLAFILVLSYVGMAATSPQFLHDPMNTNCALPSSRAAAYSSVLVSKHTHTHTHTRTPHKYTYPPAPPHMHQDGGSVWKISVDAANGPSNLGQAVYASGNDGDLHGLLPRLRGGSNMGYSRDEQASQSPRVASPRLASPRCSLLHESDRSAFAFVSFFSSQHTNPRMLIYTHTHIHTYVHTYSLHTHIHTYIHKYIHIHMPTYIDKHLHMYVRVCVCKYVWIYIAIYICIYTNNMYRYIHVKLCISTSRKDFAFWGAY